MTSVYGHFTGRNSPDGYIRESADGLNWYTFTRGMIQWDDIGRFASSSTGEVFVLIEQSTSRVVGFDRDASKLVPDDHLLLGVPPETVLQVGMIWNGSAFLPAPTTTPAVPVEVTVRQAKLALLRAGLLTAANEAIAALPGDAGQEARIEWEYAATLRRDHPLVEALGGQLGLDPDQVNALFEVAATI